MKSLSKIWNKKYKRDIIYTIVFGIISNVLGHLRIYIPEFEQTSIDLREIPLLISLVFISNPLYSIGLSFISLIDIFTQSSFFPLVITHILALSAVWYFLNYIEKTNRSGLLKGFYGFTTVVVYYFILLIPLFIFTYIVFGIYENNSFIDFYTDLLKVMNYEIIATSLTIAIFFIQHDFREKLKKHNEELEVLVIDRTQHLDDTIEELKQTQNYLIQSVKMASLGILTSGVAHEINNPLNFIQGGTDILENLLQEYGTNLPTKFIDDHKVANNMLIEGNNRISTIVKALMDFSNTGESTKKASDIHKVIDNTLLILRSGISKDILIKKEYELNIEIPMYIEKVHQLVLNILNNAIFELGDTSIKNKEISINTKQEKKFAVLEISNTGSHIPEENLNHIFDPFFTTKDPDKGKGMGLSICYSIVREHKGNISALNKEDGVCFRVEFPIKQDS